MGGKEVCGTLPHEYETIQIFKFFFGGGEIPAPPLYKTQGGGLNEHAFGCFALIDECTCICD